MKLRVDTTFRPDYAQPSISYSTTALQSYPIGNFVGLGDGSTVAFSVNYNIPINTPIYVNDWQGNQLQYSTARTNLEIRSSAVGSTGWTVTHCTATTGQTGPDAGSTAVLLTALTIADTCIGTAFTTVAATNYTASIYMKGGTSTASSFAALTSGAVALGGITIAWSAGVPTLTATGNATNTKVTKMTGAGWYRLSFEFATTTTSTEFEVIPDTAVGTSTLYAFGAQCELGISQTSYIATVATAVTVTDYSLSANTITFAVAPLANAIITTSGTVDGKRFSIQLCSTTDAHITISPNPTATANSLMLIKQRPEIFGCDPGDIVSVIRESADGVLYLTEMTR